MVFPCHLRMRNDIVHVTNVTNKRLFRWDFQKSLKGTLKTMTFPVQHLLMMSGAWYLKGMVSNNQNLMEQKPNLSWTLTPENSTGCAGRDGPQCLGHSLHCTASAGPALSKIIGESVTGGGTAKYHFSCSFRTFSPSGLRSVWNSQWAHGSPLGKHCEMQSLTKLSKPQKSPLQQSQLHLL